MKYHYTYCVHNMLNGRRYIGSRSTSKKDDSSYMGSSQFLQLDINEYGKENFYKEILKYHPSRAEANKHEYELHKKHNVVKSLEFYNRRYANINDISTTTQQ